LFTTTDPNAGQSFTYSLTGPNAGDFTVGSDGSIKTGLTNLPSGPISVGAQVKDSLGLTLSEPITVTIAKPITDLTVTPASAPVATNAPVGTVVGTVATTDPNAGQSFTYTLTGPNAGDFTVGSDGSIKTGLTNLPSGPITVGVQVTDTLGLTLTKPFTVTVYQPIAGVTLTPASAPVATDSPVGTAVGTLTTTDPNAGQSFTYLLTGPNAGEFAVDSSGNLTTAVSPLNPGPTSVGVVAKDSLGLTFTQTLTVMVASPSTDIVYVNPGWAGLSPGTVIPGPAGPLQIGANAFATIQDGANAVSPGGTLVLFGGNYSGPINITKPATVQLDGNVTLDTGGGDADFGAAVTAQTPGGDDLTINAGGGSVEFTKPVGVTPLGNLTINKPANVTFDAPVNLTGNLTETGGTATATFDGGTVAGNLTVNAGAVVLASGTLTTGTATIDASTAVTVAPGASLVANGVVVLDGGFNNAAGGSVTMSGSVVGSSVKLLGGPGSDTFTVQQVASPTTVDGGGGANLLNVDLSKVTAAQTVYVTGQGVSSTALHAPLAYQDTGGTFGKGLNVTTGPGNDTVVVQSTAAGTPTVVNTGAGNDTVIVASTTNLAASTLGGLAGPLSIDAGPGANALTVSDAGSPGTNAYFITGSAIGPSDSPNAIWFKATGGNFNGGVNFVGGQANDTYVILGTFPGAPTAVYGQGGNDTFNTGVSTASSYGNLTINGGGGANTLGVYDQSGAAVVNETPAGAGTGQVKVSYLSSPSSTVTYQNMQVVGSNVSQATSFIQALYHVELGYNAGPADVNFWLGVLNGPGGQAAVVSGIDHSPPALTRLVTGWYRQYLNRAPAGGEEQALVQRLLIGQTEETVLASLLASAEFANLGGGGDAGFVNRAFIQLLGRPASSSEVSAYVNTLIPQVGRDGAAWLILTSSDHRRQAVGQEYQQLLHMTGLRQSDIDFWALGPLDLLSIHEQLEQTTAFLNAQA
jgi:hypothetical protein